MSAVDFGQLQTLTGQLFPETVDHEHLLRHAHKNLSANDLIQALLLFSRGNQKRAKKIFDFATFVRNKREESTDMVAATLAALETFPDESFESHRHPTNTGKYIHPLSKELPSPFICNLGYLLKCLTGHISALFAQNGDGEEPVAFDEVAMSKNIKELLKFLLSKQSKRAIYFTKAICGQINVLLQGTPTRQTFTPRELADSLWPIRKYQSDEQENWNHDTFLYIVKFRLDPKFFQGVYLFKNVKEPLSFLIRQEIFVYQNEKLYSYITNPDIDSGKPSIDLEPYSQLMFAATVDQGPGKENVMFARLCDYGKFCELACTAIAASATTGIVDEVVVALRSAANLDRIVNKLTSYAEEKMKTPNFTAIARVVFPTVGIRKR